MYCDEREGKRDRDIKKKQYVLRSSISQTLAPSIY